MQWWRWGACGGWTWGYFIRVREGVGGIGGGGHSVLYHGGGGGGVSGGGGVHKYDEISPAFVWYNRPYPYLES